MFLRGMEVEKVFFFMIWCMWDDGFWFGLMSFVLEVSFSCFFVGLMLRSIYGFRCLIIICE